MIKQRKNATICLNEKKKNNTIKTNHITRENKSKGIGDRRKNKKIPRQDQTLQTGHSKTTKNVYQQVGR